MHLEIGSLVLLFVASALFLGALTRYLLRHSRVPYTVALLLLGLALGGLVHWTPVAEAAPLLPELVDAVAHMDPHLILFVFLPILIFESAYSMEVHLFRRLFGQICLLAVPGMVIASLLTAVLIQFAFPFEWSWPLALMFGALISATDPVAVVALLKEVSSRKRLETLIEGESLLNDGTAIVLFSLFFTLALAPTATGFSLPEVAGEFGWVVLAGLALGFLLGGLALLWMGQVFNDPVLEIAVTIALAYLCYFFSEHLLGVSGVVALVALALLFAGPGRTRISAEVQQFLTHFWEMMAYMANTLIFLLVGILIAARVVWDDPELWLALIGLYLALQLIRGAAVLLLHPLLERVGVGLGRAKTQVLIWCGLRGAVSLALVLTVAQEPSIPAAVRDQMLFLCAGIVVLSVVINGMSMEWLLQRLGMSGLPAAKQITVDRARRQIQEALERYLPELRREPLFQGVNWTSLQPAADVPEATGTVRADDQETAYRRRLLEVERQHYWFQFHQGTLSQGATNLLVKAVEQALDGAPEIGPRTALHPYWRAPRWLGMLRNYPGLTRWLLHISFERMALGYEVARGFALAQQAMLEEVRELAPNEATAEAVEAEVAQNCADTLHYMDALRSSFPEVVSALESRSARQLLLNRERQVLDDLTRRAVLAEPEAEKLKADLDRRCQELKRAPTSLPVLDHQLLLTQQSWLEGVRRSTLERLCHLAEPRIYQHGELLCRQGDTHAALLVVVRGTVELYVEQSDAVRLIADQGRGTLLGVEALFYGRSPMTVRAQGIVEVLWLDVERLRDPMAADQQLGEQLMALMEQQHRQQRAALAALESDAPTEQGAAGSSGSSV